MSMSPEMWKLACREWASFDREVAGLPPDLTQGPYVDRATVCNQWSPHGFYCTRAPGHSDRHAAGDGKVILAVWEQR